MAPRDPDLSRDESLDANSIQTSFSELSDNLPSPSRALRENHGSHE